MEQDEFNFAKTGRRLLSAAFSCALLTGVSVDAAAQRVEPPRIEAPRVPPGVSGVGGGAGLVAPLPQIPTAPAIAPTLPPPLPAPVPAAPEATPPVGVPAAPARVVRFRCNVAPEAEACREPGAPDGGGDDSECSCAKDLCYDQLDPATGKSHRVCEKAQ